MEINDGMKVATLARRVEDGECGREKMGRMRRHGKIDGSVRSDVALLQSSPLEALSVFSCLTR